MLDHPLGDSPMKDAPSEEAVAYAARSDDYEAVQCLMLTCMDLELQKRFGRFTSQFIIGSLEVLYKKQARTKYF